MCLDRHHFLWIPILFAILLITYMVRTGELKEMNKSEIAVFSMSVAALLLLLGNQVRYYLF